MTAAFDAQARLIRQHRTAVVVTGCNFAQGGEAVEHGQRTRHPLQCRDVGGEHVENLLVEHLLPTERAFLRRQRLVFEGLEFGRDVTLGVLECLSAAIVVWHLLGVRLAELDVEAGAPGCIRP